MLAFPAPLSFTLFKLRCSISRKSNGQTPRSGKARPLKVQCNRLPEADLVEGVMLDDCCSARALAYRESMCPTFCVGTIVPRIDDFNRP